MELPHLGEHCTEKSCHQLDFLPMKCDACEQLYCKDHLRYELHQCHSQYKKNIQVPVCPLCNQPVPWKRGDPPDLAVGDHIDRDCQSDPAKKKRKVFGNRCTLKGCKQKEMIPVVCYQCDQNFCLKHRHPSDHICKKVNPADKAREAALARASASSSRANSSSSSSSRGNASGSSGANYQRRMPQRSLSALQGNMSEDEALALALQVSMQETQPVAPQLSAAQQQEEADRLLALSLQQNEPGAQTTTPSANDRNNHNCSLS